MEVNRAFGMDQVYLSFNMSSQLEFADTLSDNFDELGNMNGWIF